MFLLRAVLNILVRNASSRGPMCFRCLTLVYQDLVSCYFCFVFLPLGPECNVVSVYVLCCPVNGSVCFVCCVFDGVCNMFGCVCYFVVECDGVGVCGWRCSIG